MEALGKLLAMLVCLIGIVAASILGLIWGWGLEPKNWGWIICSYIVVLVLGAIPSMLNGK
jgi:ABC-type amino acid transport system permease subunit